MTENNSWHDFPFCYGPNRRVAFECLKQCELGRALSQHRLAAKCSSTAISSAPATVPRYKKVGRERAMKTCRRWSNTFSASLSMAGPIGDVGSAKKDERAKSLVPRSAIGAWIVSDWASPGGSLLARFTRNTPAFLAHNERSVQTSYSPASMSIFVRPWKIVSRTTEDGTQQQARHQCSSAPLHVAGP